MRYFDKGIFITRTLGVFDLDLLQVKYSYSEDLNVLYHCVD